MASRKSTEAPIYPSLSRPTSAWITMKATVIKELRIARRYLPNLVGGIVSMGLRVVFFLLLSGVISVGETGSANFLAGRDLFIFFQGALILMVFNGPTLWGPINAVTTDLYNGTLEFLYSTPVSRYAYYVGTVLAKVLINMLIFLPFYGFLILYSKVNLFDMLMILVACGVVLVALTAMGIMIALLALLWRQVGSITEILGILFEMLAGAYLPIYAFPKAVQYVAYLMPHTWGYDLIRYYSFQGKWQTILPVWQEWGVMVLYAIIFTLVSRYLLGKAETLAKRQGLSVI
ncbi:MAG: ABC transporter permease [Anaerolineae bacterium]|nr:ABC transporter permease [Anaerolineae bacterium]